jgi:hypothetical protein
MRFTTIKKYGPLYVDSQFRDTKDPCPVFDGAMWHIYGSGGDVVTEEWKVLHATAPSATGPWVEQAPVGLVGLEGDHVAAPGVVYADKTFHMFIQTDFTAPGGMVEYLTSGDGQTFVHEHTALFPVPHTSEAGMYDPHPATIHGKKYLVYSGAPSVEREGRHVMQPDIYLAASLSDNWSGPWQRVGKILDHEDIAEHHNQRGADDYEWGIEGAQLVELPGGKVLMNAVCFLPGGVRGTRQRVFFAIAEKPEGPYRSIGPVLTSELGEWESGENGHATAIVEGDLISLFYQARSAGVAQNPWRYGIAQFEWSTIAA